MNFLINFMAAGGVNSTTSAQSGASAQGGFFGSGGSMLIIFVIFFVVLYFFSIRPNKKREKEHKAKLASINKGDRIQTIGGWRATVIAIKETTFIVKIDDRATVEIVKSAVSDVILRKGDSTSSSADVKAESASKTADVVDVDATVVKSADEQANEQKQNESVNNDSSTTDTNS